MAQFTLVWNDRRCSRFGLVVTKFNLDNIYALEILKMFGKFVSPNHVPQNILMCKF